MSKVLSDVQKQAIRAHTADTITIGTNTYHASKLWSNQKITSYPSIVLNIANSGQDTDIKDVVAGPLYYSCILTVHILAKDEIGMDSGAVICEHFADVIIDEMETWIVPFEEDVRIFNPSSDISAVGFLGHQAGYFDYVISIIIYYS